MNCKIVQFKNYIYYYLLNVLLPKLLQLRLERQKSIFKSLHRAQLLQNTSSPTILTCIFSYLLIDCESVNTSTISMICYDIAKTIGIER